MRWLNDILNSMLAGLFRRLDHHADRREPIQFMAWMLVACLLALAPLALVLVGLGVAA